MFPKNHSTQNKDKEKAEKVKNKAKVWKEKIRRDKSNKSYWKKITKELNAKIEEYKRKRDLTRTWIHISMDTSFTTQIQEKDPFVVKASNEMNQEERREQRTELNDYKV